MGEQVAWASADVQHSCIPGQAVSLTLLVPEGVGALASRALVGELAGAGAAALGADLAGGAAVVAPAAVPQAAGAEVQGCMVGQLRGGSLQPRLCRQHLPWPVLQESHQQAPGSLVEDVDALPIARLLVAAARVVLTQAAAPDAAAGGAHVAAHAAVEGVEAHVGAAGCGGGGGAISVAGGAGERRARGWICGSPCPSVWPSTKRSPVLVALDAALGAHAAAGVADEGVAALVAAPAACSGVGRGGGGWQQGVWHRAGGADCKPSRPRPSPKELTVAVVPEEVHALVVALELGLGLAGAGPGVGPREGAVAAGTARLGVPHRAAVAAGRGGGWASRFGWGSWHARGLLATRQVQPLSCRQLAPAAAVPPAQLTHWHGPRRPRAPAPRGRGRRAS